MAYELSIDPGFVRILVAKAEAALVETPNAYDDDVVAEKEIDGGTVAQWKPTDRLEEEVEGDETTAEVIALIEDLNEDEQADLVALAWVGRGDYEAAGFEEAREQAKARRESPTSVYLLEMPLLPSYLEAGLEAVAGAASTEAEA